MKKRVPIFIIIVSLIFSVTGRLFAEGKISFKNLSRRDGLIQDHVLTLFEDRDGFIWIGTFGGLNRYDGYDFKSYQSLDSNQHTLSHPTVHCVFQDRKGEIWVGTEKGLNLFDVNANRFNRINNQLSKVEIRSIVEFNEKLYIGTYGNGLFEYNPKTNEVKQINLKDAEKCNFINTLYKDKNDQLWIGFESCGIGIFDLHSQKHRKFNLVKDLQEETINCISEDQNGTFWIGTWNKGIFKADPVNGLLHNYTSSNGIPDNTVRTIIIQDKDHIVAGTKSGLSILDLRSNTIQNYSHHEKDDKSLPENFIWSLLKDRNNKVWIGTFGRGLSLMAPGGNRFEAASPENPCLPASSDNKLLLQDHKQRTWIASRDGGIAVYQGQGNCLCNKVLLRKYPDNNFYAAYEDKAGTIWLASDMGIYRVSTELSDFTFIPKTSFTKGKGFFVYDITEDAEGNIWFGGWQLGLVQIPHSSRNKKEFISSDFKVWTDHELPSLQSNTIWSIEGSDDGTIWIAGDKNVFSFDYKNNKLSPFPGSLGSKVLDIYNSGETLWLASSGEVYSYNIKSGSTQKYVLKQNNEEISLYAIKPFNDYIFLGSEIGLHVLDTKSKRFASFDFYDGMEDQSVLSHSVLASTKENIYISTVEGIIKFDPSNLFEDNASPKLYLSDEKLFGQLMDPDKLFHGNELTTLYLNYNENVLAFKISAINPPRPEKVRFFYMLEGFDNQWYERNANDRELTYTNLNPGEYYLNVKTNLADDKSSVLIRIVVRSPWWKSWWFLTIASVMLILSAIGIFYIRVRSIKERNKWLTSQVKERTKELQEANHALTEQNEQITKQTEQIIHQQSELLDHKYNLEKNNAELASWSEFQNRLIGILGHDIRGPLNNFSHLITLMENEPSSYLYSKLKDSSRTLTSLATDLVGWVNFQSHKGEIKMTSFTWDEPLEKALKEIEPFRAEKNISFVRLAKSNDTIAGLMPVVLSSIRNVLSNAIKFSLTDNIIEIETGIIKDNFSAIRITDFGKGFDAAVINKIINGEGFSGLRETTLKDGAGLGLTICNDILRQQGGWIEAASLPGSGATFFIYLPKGETIEQDVKPNVIEEKKSVQISLKEESVKALKSKKVLLVDDDDQIRWTLVRTINPFMEVHEVRSAEEAIIWLKENTPDIAVLDIRMSGISGLELCRRIKNSTDTAHVPCLLISGELEESIRKEAFAAGADAFLAKPFLPEELVLQINTYFENQEKKLKRFFDGASVDQITTNEINKVFLMGFLKLVEDNLNSPNLNVDFLSKELGMSRSTLYRNLKGITGETVNSFIKNIRMRKSFLLLKEGKMNISEIAAETGFNSPSYFTTSFKKHFGFSPNELKG